MLEPVGHVAGPAAGSGDRHGPGQGEAGNSQGLGVRGKMGKQAEVEALGCSRKADNNSEDRAEEVRKPGRGLDDQDHNSQVVQGIGPAGGSAEGEEDRTLGWDSADNPAHDRCRWTWF